VCGVLESISDTFCSGLHHPAHPLCCLKPDDSAAWKTSGYFSPLEGIRQLKNERQDAADGSPFCRPPASQGREMPFRTTTLTELLWEEVRTHAGATRRDRTNAVTSPKPPGACYVLEIQTRGLRLRSDLQSKLQTPSNSRPRLNWCNAYSDPPWLQALLSKCFLRKLLGCLLPGSQALPRNFWKPNHGGVFLRRAKPPSDLRQLDMGSWSSCQLLSFLKKDISG